MNSNPTEATTMDSDPESPQENLGYRKSTAQIYNLSPGQKMSSASKESSQDSTKEPRYLRIRLRMDKSIRRYNVMDGLDLINRGKAELVEEVW